MRSHFLFILGTAVVLVAEACADERQLEFIRRLQERGFHDVVVEYVESIRSRGNVADDVKTTADFWIGNSLLAGAELVPELERRDEQLQRARASLERFVRENPEHERAAEAQMDQARILIERGRVALLESESPRNESRKLEYRDKARSFYETARQSFTDAQSRFQTEFKKFPAFIPEEQKRQREAKSAAQVSAMQAQLHLGLVEYEYAQTYDKSSSEFKKSLQEAVAIFERVRIQYR